MALKSKKTTERDKDSSSSEILHRFKTNPALFIGTIIVLILVIVSFVLVPALVPEGRKGGGDLTFGYYDKVPISWVPGNYFARYQEYIAQYYQRIMDTSQLQYEGLNIWRQAFEGAAVHTAILQEMKKSKYTVPVKTVDKEVAKLPQFQDEKGRFSPTLYQKMSSNSRLVLWRQMQEELTKTQYLDDMKGLLQSTEEAKFIGNMSSKMRSFETTAFQVDAYPDSEYLAFARGNPDLFKSIHLSRISVNSSEKEALSILASIKDGTSTFEDAARSQSQDGYADRGGDMGVSYLFELEQEITDAQDREKIISLNKDELSGVIKAGERWAFFRAEEELKPANFEDEAVMERVRAYMRNYERGRMEDWAVEQAKAFIADANSDGFDSALEKHGKSKGSFGPVPVNYGSVDLFASLESLSITDFSSQDLSDLSRNHNFWKTAFSTRLNTLSEPLVQGSKVLVLFATEQIEAEESSIEGIASTYSSYWLSNANDQSFQTYFINSSKMDNRFIDTYFRYFTSY
jgi:parvulin-like peptidyl-prolyl isomerase